MGSDRGGRLAPALLVVVAFQTHLLAAQSDRSAVRPGDALSVMVAGQPAVSGKYVVDVDGTVNLPLVGRLDVRTATADELEARVRQRFTDFFVNPQVRVAVERAKRVFVLGEVAAPGPLDLTENLTLLEALARVGYTGNSEVIVVRPSDANGPALAGDPDAEVIRVNLRGLEKALESGRLSDNVLLTEGDTIYVPREDPNRVYVSGEVGKPGAYAVPDGTTVLQTVTLAGGATEDAAMGRLRLVRVVNGEQQSKRASLDDFVQPGDTVVVPERFAFPTLQMGPGRSDRPSRAYHVGRALSFAPIGVLRRIGFDTNVLSESEPAITDFTVVGGPQLDVFLDLRCVRATATGAVDFVYFRQHASERSVNRSGTGAVELLPWRRLTLRAAGTQARTSDRLDAEVDGRIRRLERSLDAAIRVNPWGRVEVELAGRAFERLYDPGALYRGVDLHDTLTEQVRTASATLRFGLTRMTFLAISGTASTHRFPHLPAKDADAAEGSVGAIFKPGALVSGEVRVGYLRYVGFDPIVPDLRSPVGSVELNYRPVDRTRLAVRAGRMTGDAFRPQFSYALVDRMGGSVEQGIFRRFDLRAETYLEKDSYRVFGLENIPTRSLEQSETTQRYTSELGVRLGPTRVGFNVTYVHRLSRLHRGRNYDALYAMANFSYGALGVQGL